MINYYYYYDIDYYCKRNLWKTLFDVGVGILNCQQEPAEEPLCCTR